MHLMLHSLIITHVHGSDVKLPFTISCYQTGTSKTTTKQNAHCNSIKLTNIYGSSMIGYKKLAVWTSDRPPLRIGVMHESIPMPAKRTTHHQQLSNYGSMHKIPRGTQIIIKRVDANSDFQPHWLKTRTQWFI